MTSDDPAAEHRPAEDRPAEDRPAEDRPADAQPADAQRGKPPAGRQDALVSALIRSGNLEYDRILFFSDAVFAIAITLLAIDLRVPLGVSIQSGHELHEAIPGIISFAISFAVIGLFWLAHHGLFRFITAFDRPLILLNLLFLGTIAFLPYPTELLGVTSTNQAPAVIFYAACVAAAGLAEVAAWTYATRPGSGLAGPDIARVRLSQLLQAARVPVVFLLSIPVAVVSPTAATLFWILILPADVIVRRLVPDR